MTNCFRETATVDRDAGRDYCGRMVEAARRMRAAGLPCDRCGAAATVLGRRDGRLRFRCAAHAEEDRLDGQIRAQRDSFRRMRR